MISRGNMHNFRTAAACLLTAATLSLTACGGGTADSDSGKPAATTNLEPAATAAPAVSLPVLTGTGLPAALDAAALAGYANVSAHDATGAERPQSLDGDWQVCFQHPGPGPVATSGHIELAVVKNTEQCPAVDASPAP